VNPDFELKSSGMKMGGGPKQFGIDAERVPQALADIARRGLSFEGFHIFSGSQNLRSASICESQVKAFDLALKLAETAPAPPRVLNLGGGFGIPYFPGEARLDLLPIGANLSDLASRAKSEMGAVELVIELGRYIVGEAGIYVSRVIDRKISRGSVFLVVDGGLHHHLAASGNFGQVIRKNYPVCNGTRVFSGPRETVSVVGPLCTPLDLLGERIEIGAAEPDSLIAVLQSGAYGLTASPTRFLGHPGPEEVLV
jgi:diaminopimelate decarboxylase